MNLALTVAIAVVGGLIATVATTVDRRWGTAFGLLAAVATIVAALAVRVGETLPVGDSVVTVTTGIRSIALAWALGALLLGLIDALTERTAAIVGPSLLGLGLALVALVLDDAAVGFAILAAAATAAVIVPGVRGSRPDDDARGDGIRAERNVVVASLLGLGLATWSAAPGGPLGSGAANSGLATGSPGLALLGIATAVTLRTAAVPAHVWAARLVERIPAPAVPALLGWGSAAFSLTAFAWAEVALGPAQASMGFERALVGIAAIACVVLAGIAAALHDDLEHVLVYALVQSAGVALLAFVAPTSQTTTALRDWVVGTAAVAAGLAGWIGATGAAFGSRRIGDLGGWARRAPVLALAFGAILVGSVGVPGAAIFDARAALVRDVVQGPVGILVLVAGLAPLVYLGRILVVGIRRQSVAVAAARDMNLRWRGGRTEGWTTPRSASAVASAFLAVPAEVAANRAALAGLAALGLSALGLAIAIAGVR